MADTPVITPAFNTAGAKKLPASPLSPAEVARRAEVNGSLLRIAQWRFEQTTMPLAGSSYTSDLYKQEKAVRDILLQQGNTAMILDPATFDAGLALGMKPAETVERMVMGEPPGLLDIVKPNYKDGIVTGIQSISDADLKKCVDYLNVAGLYDFQALADDMRSPYKTVSGAVTHTQFPTARHYGSDMLGSCVIVPASDIGNIKVRGLSHEDNLTYINLHESWHCRDAQLQMYDTSTVGFNPSVDIRYVPDDPQSRTAYARNNQMESFADVAATGEMIRKGKGLETLDAVMDFRQRSAAEVRHYTLPALRAFREEIDKMGVENFRKLNEQDAEKLYRRMVDENALTARGVEIIQNRESGNPFKSLAPMLLTRFYDDEVSRALAFRRSHTMDRMVGFGKELTTWDTQAGVIAHQLENWNALKLLQDRSFADAGKITPATLVQAYGDLKDDLRDRMRKDPGNTPLYEAQMAKLRDTFVDSVGKTDYVAVNLTRGVRIEDVEGLTRTAAKPAQGAANVR